MVLYELFVACLFFLPFSWLVSLGEGEGPCTSGEALERFSSRYNGLSREKKKELYRGADAEPRGRGSGGVAAAKEVVKRPYQPGPSQKDTKTKQDPTIDRLADSLHKHLVLQGAKRETLYAQTPVYCKSYEYALPAHRSVNPWEVEYQPNPVIYASLKDDIFPNNHGPSKTNEAELHNVRVDHSGSFSPENSTSVKGIALDPWPIAENVESTPDPEAYLRSGFDSTFWFDSIVAGEPQPPDLNKAYTEAEYRCSTCDATFRTRGLLNSHVNRKHDRRYACDRCDRTFFLGADLKRHVKTVHKGDGGSSELVGRRCTNASCQTPQKIWPREDNLKRHLLRCEKKALRIGGSAHLQSSTS